MKKTFGALGLLALGAIGIISFASGETSQSQVVVACASGTVSIEVTNLDFGSVATQLDPQDNVAGTWQTGSGGDGLIVTDTLAGCSATGTLWAVTLAFENLTGSNLSKTLTINSTRDTDVDANGDGNIAIDVTQTAGDDDTSGQLTQLDGADSNYVSADGLSASAFTAPGTAQQLLSRTYNASDSAVGTWQLIPTMEMNLPGSLVADTYQGVITVALN